MAALQSRGSRLIATIIVMLSGASAGLYGATTASTSPRSAPAVSPEQPLPRFAESVFADAFLKGNIHAHTTRSDGDSPPKEVYAWYRDHGYAFLAITDHNLITEPVKFASETNDPFTLVRGEEVTMMAEGKPVHVNAICTKTAIDGGTFRDKRSALSHAIRAIHAQGGVALVNHPNFEWALTAADLVGAPRFDLLEIASGHPFVRARGDATHPSAEALWDAYLTQGGDAAPAAVDDVHDLGDLRDVGEPPAPPGRAWIQVFGHVAQPPAICTALREKRLYASTGMELRTIRVSGARFEVQPTYAARVEFIGGAGEILHAVDAAPGEVAEYELLNQAVRFVRARASGPSGKAWTKAYAVVR